MADYCTTVFEQPTLTRIHGEPTFEEGIRILHKEVMVNAWTEHSELGGGTHGHVCRISSVATKIIYTIEQCCVQRYVISRAIDHPSWHYPTYYGKDHEGPA